jgi:long-chain acyl-CoA synthetase
MAMVGLEHFREKNPDFVCMVEPDRREWSRDEVVGHVNRLSRAFRRAGLVDGDVVAIISPSCVEYVIVYFAATRAGMSVVPVNWHLSESELRFLINDSSAKAIVAHESLGFRQLDQLRHMSPAALLFLSIGNAQGYVALGDFSGSCPDEPLNLPVWGRVMAYTSATTGRPKAVLLPPQNASDAIRRRIEVFGLLGILPEDNNVRLSVTALYHAASLGLCDFSLTMGHKLVLLDQWHPELLLHLIDRYHVTNMFLVPSMFVRLLKLSSEIRGRYSMSSLRVVTHGGAPCPEAVKREMLEWWGPIIWEAYGATEVVGTVASPQEWLRYPGTVGRPLMPESAIRILDEQCKEVPPRQIGRVFIKPCAGNLFEYKGEPERTRQSYADGFITVGDLGYLNEDGYLFLCDRSADLIISSGTNIYPAEIEAQLIGHPAIRDCAVVGQSHPILGSVPKAFVELAAGFEACPSLTVDILHFLGSRLAAMKVPKRIEYINSIPRDPNGKLFKRRLLENDK